VFTQVGPR